MSPRNDNRYFRGQSNNAVAAKTIAQKRGIISSALYVACLLERFLNFAAKFVRLVMQPLFHQNHINNILRPGSAKVRLFLNYLTNYKLKPLHHTTKSYTKPGQRARPPLKYKNTFYSNMINQSLTTINAIWAASFFSYTLKNILR
jgi:hypothetical protein